MKNRFWVMNIITLITLSGVVRGSEPIKLIMGSEDSVKEYWAKKVYWANAWIGQNTLDPKIEAEIFDYWDQNLPKNYADLCQRAQRFAVRLAEYGLTNKTTRVDPSKPFFVAIATVESVYSPMGPFWFYKEFSYEKVDGKYIVPASLGEIFLPLDSHPIVARIPGIDWAKIVVTDLAGQVINEFDGFLDPSSYGELIFPDGDLLRMKLEYVTFEGKPIKVEVYLMENGRYHSFLNGVEQPWKQPRLGISPISGGMQITVTGDPNQTFNLEVSDDLKTWNNVAVGFIPYRNSWKWTDESLLPRRFYRLSPLLPTVEQKNRLIEAYKTSLRLTVRGM